jgi:hypothetical protein
MLLAVLPLFFAWRSLSSYFYCSAFPLFVLMAARMPLGQKALARQKLQGRSEPVIKWYGGALVGMPAMTHMRLFAYPAQVFRQITHFIL